MKRKTLNVQAVGEREDADFADIQGKKLPHVRTTERRDFKRCQQRWWWAWRQGLKSTEMKNALWFGIGMHMALAEYYQLGYKRNKKEALEVWEAYCEEEVRVIRDEDDDQHNAHTLGRKMLEGYFVKWEEKDKDLDIIAIEKPFSILVPNPDKMDEDVAIYDGTYDGVFRHRVDKTFNILEHKTAKSITTEHLTLDDQAGSYLWVATAELRHAGLLTRRQAITGILYNFLRKAMPDETRERNEQGLYLNKNGTVSKVQPAPLFVRWPVTRTIPEHLSQLRRVAGEVQQMQLLKDDKVTILKTPTRDCAWDCAFFEMCELHEADQDWKEYREALYYREDPYLDHRKSTEGY